MESKDNLKFKLYYFDIRGRAEPIRVMLHYCGREFEDVKFSVTEWEDVKKCKLFQTV